MGKDMRMSIGMKIAHDYANSYCVGDCAKAIDDAITPLISALDALEKVGYLRVSPCAGKEGKAVLKQAIKALKEAKKAGKV